MSADQFRRAEDEYFRLKGQFAAGRITPEQFEAAIKNLMVQDAQGRYWMLGPDTGKWYVHDGTTWVEAQPPTTATRALRPTHFRRLLAAAQIEHCALAHLRWVRAAYFARRGRGVLRPESRCRQHQSRRHCNTNGDTDTYSPTADHHTTTDQYAIANQYTIAN